MQGTWRLPCSNTAVTAQDISVCTHVVGLAWPAGLSECVKGVPMPCRALAGHTARLAEAQQRAAGAARAAQCADDAYVAAQERVQRLREQSSAAEDCLAAAVSQVEECLVTLGAAEAANKAAQEAMKVRTLLFISVTAPRLVASILYCMHLPASPAGLEGASGSFALYATPCAQHHFAIISCI